MTQNKEDTDTYKIYTLICTSKKLTFNPNLANKPDISYARAMLNKPFKNELKYL